MIGSAIPVQSRAAIEISRLWCAADFGAWLRAEQACRARGVRLVDVISERFRWYRDACARKAFDRRLPAWQIAREWRIARARGAPIVIQVSGTRGGEREVTKVTDSDPLEIIEARIASATAGQGWGPL